jgi:uncharacterized protein YhaN
MRIRQLDLLAFGAFHGRTLDFSAPGLHLVFGRNEAGKSTTLRAVAGLLYGIPAVTPDAYLHRYDDLRIGARLEGADGDVLDVVRKKGRTRTLADRQGEPVDEARLTRMLHGVGEEAFRTTFGLSHVTLREGGESLLHGGGDLGESLFQAGLGGSALHLLVAELKDGADAIFSAQARTKPLNEWLRRFADAQRAVRDKSATRESVLLMERHI